MKEVTVGQAKRMLKECVEIYLEKDAKGQYCLPQNKQRPVYLEGPSGIGKTELVRQVAEEAQIGFVSYSMTHHSRQSAVGLPAIVEKELNGKTYRATEYTMSEIVEAVWNAVRDGSREGILFTDEVNCVSETLMAAMLQFLQNKTFGSHRIPEGWIVVAAGNPPEHNYSVKRFDAATLDRLRVIHMRPDRNDWLAYAAEKGMHPLVIQYVREHPEEFYCFQMQKGRQDIATARGWEDLGNMLKAYEKRGYEVDEALVGSFIQNEKIAGRFLHYYCTARELVSAKEIRAILNREVGESVTERFRSFDFQERWSVMVCIYSMLQGDVEEILSKLRAHDARGEKLREKNAAQERRKECFQGDAEERRQELERFRRDTEELGQELGQMQRSIGNALWFLEQEIGEGKESELLMTMMLDNENFQKLSEYCQLDCLVDAYERMQSRMKATRKEIRAWIRRDADE